MSSDVRVLLVEDDELIRRALGMALRDEGFEVLDATSGEDALACEDLPWVDVVLLDLMLPGMDGMAVCRTLRSRTDLPIIMVTARTGTADIIAGLEAGADDYVSKPLVASELAARVRALLRRHRSRGHPPSTDAIRLGDLDIRPQEQVVRRDGLHLHLARTEFLLLVELAEAAGRVVSRPELLRRIGGYDYVADTRLLDVHVRRLRRKIEADPDNPTLVLTVRGSGYRVNSEA